MCSLHFASPACLASRRIPGRRLLSPHRLNRWRRRACASRRERRCDNSPGLSSLSLSRQQPFALPSSPLKPSAVGREQGRRWGGGSVSAGHNPKKGSLSLQKKSHPGFAGWGVEGFLRVSPSAKPGGNLSQPSTAPPRNPGRRRNRELGEDSPASRGGRRVNEQQLLADRHFPTHEPGATSATGVHPRVSSRGGHGEEELEGNRPGAKPAEDDISALSSCLLQLQ